MRKILSEGEKRRKERFNQIIVGVVLIFLLLLSTLGYSILSRDNTETSNDKKIIYNGLTFVNSNGYWILQEEGIRFVFRYNPNEIEGVKTKLNDISMYSNQPVYIQSDSMEATSEIVNNLNGIVLRMQNACLEEEGCEEDFPVKNCNDNFIIIRESNLSGIIQNQSCVFIEGTQENLVKLTDEFLFKILGISE